MANIPAFNILNQTLQKFDFYIIFTNVNIVQFHGFIRNYQNKLTKYDFLPWSLGHHRFSFSVPKYNMYYY